MNETTPTTQTDDRHEFFQHMGGRVCDICGGRATDPVHTLPPADKTPGAVFREAWEGAYKTGTVASADEAGAQAVLQRFAAPRITELEGQKTALLKSCRELWKALTYTRTQISLRHLLECDAISEEQVGDSLVELGRVLNDTAATALRFNTYPTEEPVDERFLKEEA